MSAVDKNEVDEAFEILLEGIEAVANALNEKGAQAFRAPYWKGWRNWAAARQWRSPEPSRAEAERDVLNEYDREYLSSATQAVRWWNAAQWCRNPVVREGLMKSDSPYGIWEISEHSYKWLTKHSCNP